jgi:uncharacterized protein (TIGR02246 family)
MRSMKTPSMQLVVLMLPFMFMGWFIVPVDAASSGAANTAITAQAQVFMRAIERGDAAAVAALYTEDARLSVPGSHGVVAGRAGIQKFWQAAFDAGLTGLPLEAVDLDGRGDLRLETGSYTARGKDGAELGRGYYLLAWKREGGAWKIHRDVGNASPMQPMAQPAAAMTRAPMPAGGADRVGFPADYRQGFKLLAVAARDDGSEIMTTYANAAAALVTQASQLPYPDGAVIVMEFAAPFRDGEGQLLRDSSGQLLKGEVAHVDVMRRGSGLGAIYGEQRAGEWAFASYSREGRTLIAPENAGHCAACHARAGVAQDFVFRSKSRLAAQ